MNEVTQIEARQGWMATLAKAPAGLLLKAWSDVGIVPEYDWLRVPEVGAVMVRGAMGGTGAAFNLGEMTVTRCALQLESGAVGHAYISGRDRKKAEIAALCDALMQTENAAVVRARIIVPVADALRDQRANKAQKAAATKVDFFTLVRGED